MKSLFWQVMLTILPPSALLSLSPLSEQISGVVVNSFKNYPFVIYFILFHVLFIIFEVPVCFILLFMSFILLTLLKYVILLIPNLFIFVFNGFFRFILLYRLNRYLFHNLLKLGQIQQPMNVFKWWNIFNKKVQFQVITLIHLTMEFCKVFVFLIISFITINLNFILSYL